MDKVWRGCATTGVLLCCLNTYQWSRVVLEHQLSQSATRESPSDCDTHDSPRWPRATLRSSIDRRWRSLTASRMASRTAGVGCIPRAVLGEMSRLSVKSSTRSRSCPDTVRLSRISVCARLSPPLCLWGQSSRGPALQTPTLQRQGFAYGPESREWMTRKKLPHSS